MTQLHAWALRNIIKYFSRRYVLLDIPPDLAAKCKLLGKYRTIRDKEFVYLGRNKVVIL